MITEDRGLMMLAEANPVRELDSIDVDVEAASYLATLETRSSEVTQLDTRPETPKKTTNRGMIIGLAASVAVILAVTVALLLPSAGEEPVAATTTVSAEAVGPEEAALAAYATARNSGDIDAVVGLFEEHGEQKRHPLDTDGYMNGSSEIRTVESRVLALQGSGSGVEFFDIEVADGSSTIDPDLTFRWRFFYGADGTESGGEAGCVGGKNGNAFIVNGRIAFLDWGFEDATACDN